MITTDLITVLMFQPSMTSLAMTQVDDVSATEPPSMLPPATVTTQTKTKVTKTFSDTTCVKTRSVTTTSRHGRDKVVTKNSDTTTTRTRRAKVRLEPMGGQGSEVTTVQPLSRARVSSILDDFVRAMDNDGNCVDDDDAVITADDEAGSCVDVIITDTGEASPTSNDDTVLAKRGSARSAREEWVKAGDETMTSLRDDVMTKRNVDVSSGFEPKFMEWYSAPKYRDIPEGKSYKELYFDNPSR